MRYAKLTSTGGQPVFVNPQHVVAVHTDRTKGQTRVITTNSCGGSPYYIIVKGAPESVAQVIEQATKEPSILDNLKKRGGNA